MEDRSVAKEVKRQSGDSPLSWSEEEDDSSEVDTEEQFARLVNEVSLEIDTIHTRRRSEVSVDDQLLEMLAWPDWQAAQWSTMIFSDLSKFLSSGAVDILVAYFVEGYSLKEIATAQKRSLVDVRRTMQKSLEILRGAYVAESTS